MSESRLFSDLYLSVLPPVRGTPATSMPRHLYDYVWKVSRNQQLRLCLLTLPIFPLSLVPLELQRRIIDDAVSNGDVRLLTIFGAIYLAALLLHGGLKYLRNVYQDRIAEGVIRLLRQRILHTDSFGTETDEGTRQSIMVAEAEKVGGFVGESLSFPLMQAGMVVSVAGYMLVVDPLIAIIAMAFFAPSVIFVPIIQGKVNRLMEQRTRFVRELGERALAPEPREADDSISSRSLIERIYDRRIRIFVLKYAMKFLNNLIGHLGPLSILMVGGWLAIRGEAQVGVIVAFISGYERMTNPARDLLNFYRRLSSMRVQYRLVREAATAAAG